MQKHQNILITVITSAFIAFALGGTAVAQTAILGETQLNQQRVALQLPAYQDGTKVESLQQAMIQFQRLAGTTLNQSLFELRTPLHIDASTTLTWVEITLTNATPQTSWMISLQSHDQQHLVMPIKALRLYDPSISTQPIATWSSHSSDSIPTLAYHLPTNQPTKRYIAIETWSGLSGDFIPVLKTQAVASAESKTLQHKINMLLALVGFIFGAGFIQFCLSKQPLQLVVAVSGVVLGAVGYLQLQPHALLTYLPLTHGIQLAFIVTTLLGVCAGLILHISALSLKENSPLSIVVIGLNIIAALVGSFGFGLFNTLPFNLSILPAIVQTVTAILLVVGSFQLMAKHLNFAWYIPAWLCLGIMPWLSTDYSFMLIILYGVLLVVSAVAFVFGYWQNMGRETIALQRRLRQELKYSKEKHDTETRDWQQKLDSERILLNELKAREQQRSAELDIARQDAEAANKAKSDFLAIISHEIRTPMNGIMGIVQLMHQTPMNEKQLEYVDVIKNSGDTMLTLLNDILDYSKIEKGAIEIEQIPMALRNVVQSVATLMSGRAKDKGLDVIIEIEDTIPDHLLGDPNRLRQILLNLVSNAIKFTERGTVTIRITAQSIAKHAVSLMFSVIDTGMGIAPDVQAKLFQPYVQADASISRRFGGTGLGLNICRMLVSAMKGEIGLTSELDKGSRFWFHLDYDVAPDDIAIKTVSTEHYQPSRLLNVLVIDDNSVNLKVVQGLLEMDGHTVVTSAQATNGLKLINERPFDLVFVDLLMPGMDGKAFALQLRQNPNPHIARTPIYALTGMGGEVGRQAAQSSGMQGVLTKPITHQALRAVIESIAKTIQFVVNDSDSTLKDIINKLNNLAPAEREKLSNALQSGTMGAKELYELMKQSESTPMTVSNETILSMTMLSDLKNSLPITTLKSLFDELIPKAWELTGDIEKAGTDKNLSELTERAHNLKGMCGNFGLEAMMNLCGEIEVHGHQNELDAAIALIPKVRPLLDRTLKELDEWMKG